MMTMMTVMRTMFLDAATMNVMTPILGAHTTMRMTTSLGWVMRMTIATIHPQATATMKILKT